MFLRHTISINAARYAKRIPLAAIALFWCMNATAAASADLSITITDSPDPVTAGSNLTYLVTVTNSGPNAAATASWTDTLPAGTTFVSLPAVAGWSCTTPAVGAAGTVSCSNASMAVGLSVFVATVAVSPTTASGSVLSNTVLVSSATADSNPGNNSATATTTVATSADLSITNTDSPDPVAAGAHLTYTVTVTNSGPSAASTASWTDTLPGGTTFVSLPAVAGWSCTTPAVGAAGTVSCSNASMAVGSTGFAVTVAVSAATAPGSVLSNTALVSSATTDSNPGNNSATASTTVSAAFVPPPEVTIPPLGVAIAGVTTLPPIVNMAAGEGPSFMADLVLILSNAVGQALQFVEQNAQGSVVLHGFNGGNLAFMPHSFQTGDVRANGVYAVGNGQYQVVRGGQSLVIAPALVRLDQLTQLQSGVAATLKDSGQILANVNGVGYVLQPGVVVQLDAPSGAARLVMGGDGYFHFIDTQGNNQVLYPAFAEPASLRSILQGMDPSATLNVQLDGTALAMLKGVHYSLVPDLILGGVPADRVGQSQWQESATRYRLLNVSTAPANQTTQGFGVKP